MLTFHSIALCIVIPISSVHKIYILYRRALEKWTFCESENIESHRSNWYHQSNKKRETNKIRRWRVKKEHITLRTISQPMWPALHCADIWNVPNDECCVYAYMYMSLERKRRRKTHSIRGYTGIRRKLRRKTRKWNKRKQNLEWKKNTDRVKSENFNQID